MAGTILSHQVKFFAGSTPEPAASHSERSEESLFFLLAINMKGYSALCSE